MEKKNIFDKPTMCFLPLAFLFVGNNVQFSISKTRNLISLNDMLEYQILFLPVGIALLMNSSGTPPPRILSVIFRNFQLKSLHT